MANSALPEVRIVTMPARPISPSMCLLLGLLLCYYFEFGNTKHHLQQFQAMQIIEGATKLRKCDPN
eukprot:4520544-Amphidinium_carterae.1